MPEKEDRLIYSALGSALSGTIGRIPCHPIDTCKAKIQIQQNFLRQGLSPALKKLSLSDPHAQSSFLQKVRQIPTIGMLIAGDPSKPAVEPQSRGTQVFMRTLQREGIAGLYRGFMITGLGAVPATCLFFTSYEASRKTLGSFEFFNKRQWLADFCGGFSAEFFSCILWVPIDVIKERMQVQSIIEPELRYRNPFHAMSVMTRTEGARSLFKAYGATVGSFGPFSAIYLMSHEQIKHRFATYYKTTPNDLPATAFFLSGGLAGAIAAFITNPLDLVKLRMQVSRGPMSMDFGYRNIVQGVYALFRDEGFRTLFSGATARVAFHAPNTSISIALYEICTRFVKKRFRAEE